MPALHLVRLIPNPSAEEPYKPINGLDVCGDCDGTGVDTDTDGTLTGTVGAHLPCVCTGGRW